ncbi:MAG: hypothetical protein AAGB22_08470, partial [Bacteroidota bacterium]
AYMHKGPAAVRYPRGNGPNHAIQKEMTSMPVGKGSLVRQGKKIALLVRSVRVSGTNGHESFF